MKFLDLFAGVGGFRLGLEQAGHECVGFCEIDKFARKSYKAMYDTKGEAEWHDITTITDEHIRPLRGRVDIITGGFPCQSFSIAGKRGGFNDTRGTLFFEIVRIANILRPRYLFLENVKGLLNHDNGNTFETILRALDELGYDAEWDLLNTKDFSTRKRPTPQNRERVFIIGHLRGASGRKVFPVEGNNGSADINIIGTTKKRDESIGQREVIYGSDGTIGSLTATDYKQPKRIMVEGSLDIKAKEQNKKVYNTRGLSPCLTTMQGGGQEPKITIRENTKKGYVEATAWDGIRLDHPNGTTGRGRIQKQSSPTLTTSGNAGTITGKLRIRKLTPKECFRLQGFPDELFHKAEAVNSNSQLYKQVGNSVTVNVIYEIAKKL